MNHAQLKAFHAVARNGGFSSAARALGVTQPTLTVQVRALEDGYRVALFHRRGRRVTLTRAGEELYTIAQRYFSVEREAEEFLRAEGSLSRGRIAIAADGPFHVMPLIGAIPDIEGAYVATGHNCWGMLNAPGTGYAIAELITQTDTTVPMVSALGPARLGTLRFA